MSYFLTDIAKEKGITIRDWCEGVGVSDSTARWHLKAKRIPDPKCWKRIARFLKFSMQEVEALFREELVRQNRIVYCRVCRTEFFKFNRKLLCGSPDCLRTFDRARKASHRKKNPAPPPRKKLSKEDFHAVYTGTGFKKTPQITREALSVKVREYLDSGGKITHLNPTIADGLIAETWGENYSALQRIYRYKTESDIYNDF